MKLLFLDIDGVLNDHSFNDEAKSSTLLPRCVEQLNQIIEATGAQIVLSSAWRYQIIGGDCTLKGFEYMLRSHGVTAKVRIQGRTRADEVCAHCDGTIKLDQACRRCEKVSTRGDQISAYVKNISRGEPVAYVVIDDLDLGITAASHPFVKTDGNVGLTPDDAKAAIAILGAL